MFFIGSLTTILPYLGTILIMVLFHIIGSPVKDLLHFSSSPEDKVVEIKDNCKNVDTSGYASYCLTEKIEVKKHTTAPLNTSHTLMPTTVAVPAFSNKADGNKAPPALS